MPKKEICNDIRRIIINQSKRGIKKKDIAESLDLNYNSVCTSIRRYNGSGIVDIQP